MIQGVVNPAYEVVIPPCLARSSGPHERDRGRDRHRRQRLSYVAAGAGLRTRIPLRHRCTKRSDGSEVTFDVDDATVMWGGQPRLVYALW